MKKNKLIFVIIFLSILLGGFLILLNNKNISLSDIKKSTYKSPIVKRHANPSQGEYVIVLKSKSNPTYSSCEKINNWDERGKCVYKRVIQAAAEQKNKNAEIFQYLSSQSIEYIY